MMEHTWMLVKATLLVELDPEVQLKPPGERMFLRPLIMEEIEVTLVSFVLKER